MPPGKREMGSEIETRGKCRIDRQMLLQFSTRFNNCSAEAFCRRRVAAPRLSAIEFRILIASCGVKCLAGLLASIECSCSLAIWASTSSGGYKESRGSSKNCKYSDFSLEHCLFADNRIFSQFTEDHQRPNVCSTSVYRTREQAKPDCARRQLYNSDNIENIERLEFSEDRAETKLCN